jgi:hypothetical protein
MSRFKLGFSVDDGFIFFKIQVVIATRLASEQLVSKNLGASFAPTLSS